MFDCRICRHEKRINRQTMVEPYLIIEAHFNDGKDAFELILILFVCLDKGCETPDHGLIAKTASKVFEFL